jgi:hypothetical protein
LQQDGRLPTRYDRVGAWWRGNVEVDVVAVADDGAVLLGECKWSKHPVGADVLEALICKAQPVVRDLRAPRPEVRYALWSRSGFTSELVHRARQDAVLLFDLEALA